MISILYTEDQLKIDRIRQDRLLILAQDKQKHQKRVQLALDFFVKNDDINQDLDQCPPIP